MKVTPLPTDPLANKPGAAVNGSAVRANRSLGSALPTATPPSSPDVTLSPEANLLARAEQLMEKAPEIDWQRVTELRQAIQSGQFRVNPERIADRLVSEVEHLLSQAQ